MINPSNLPYDKTAPWYQYHRLMAQGKNGMHLEWTYDPDFGHGWIMVMELDQGRTNGQPSLEQQQGLWFDEVADFGETMLKKLSTSNRTQKAWSEKAAKIHDTTWRKGTGWNDPADWYGADESDFH